MHWSSEWAEQHYDITSTTSTPAHSKPVSYPQPSNPAFSGYSDDISALSASTLLKRYAERYSFSPVYPEPGTFRRSEPAQDACGSHLYPRPTYLHQPAFALTPTYPPPAPVYTYPPGLTTSSSPSLLPPLSSSLHSAHTAPPPKRAEECQEHDKTFGFDQNKSTSVSPFTARENSEHPISNSIANTNADLQPFRPDMKVDLVRKSSYLQPPEVASYSGAEQYTYP
ncbi:hypothetical protein HF521_001001 [Silurus meridionalis]|uniref:Uncharacterized protein n=1 Tax=Silurus meridionalis TaxID=175797 RepID=A0A8T0C0Y5_SILME|nr:hypothetical protein HF521_001001 [Silurus meridionalis]